MNKISKLLLGVAALGLAACSNDEPIQGPENGANAGKGDVAYLNICIQSAQDAASKAQGTITDENGTEGSHYLYGDGDENKVTSAHFYFYDAEGNFVTTANRWNGGNTNDAKPDENVEYFGNNVVVLENLDKTGYPVWMVTILNQPAGTSYAGLSLDELGKEVIDSYENDDPNGPFIMTTSSYFGTDNADGANKWRYYATKLNTNNFYQQTPDLIPVNPEDVVEVFVERLAVRVNVDVANLSNAKSAKQYTDPKTGKKYDLYRIDATVGGENNPSTGTGTGNDNINNGAATKLYVAIIGWDLNSTAKRTNLVKNLDGWNSATTFPGGTWNTPDNVWNHAGNHRSYWGKSFTYGLSDTDLDNALLTNQTWEDLKLEVATERLKGDRAYCNENTNEPANLTGNADSEYKGKLIRNKTTNVVLRAVVCDENGNPVQLVQYLGMNYVDNMFIKKALEKANLRNVYIREEDGKWQNGDQKYKYTQIGENDVEIVSNAAEQGTGAVMIQLKPGTYYTNVRNGEEVKWEDPNVPDGYENKVVTWTPLIADEITDLSGANKTLKTATNGSSNKAIGYKDGSMYYPLPIEHLNQNADKTKIIEGQYGVVRNHVYTISVTKIKTLGEGVYKPESIGENDPAEILNPKDPKEPTYYVESKINILSWKIVSQDVEI